MEKDSAERIVLFTSNNEQYKWPLVSADQAQEEQRQRHVQATLEGMCRSDAEFLPRLNLALRNHCLAELFPARFRGLGADLHEGVQRALKKNVPSLKYLSCDCCQRTEWLTQFSCSGRLIWPYKV